MAEAGYLYRDKSPSILSSVQYEYVDISSGAYVDAKIARKCVDVLGTERVLYGTDGPFGMYNKHNRFDMKRAFGHATAKLNEAEKKLILHDNYCRIGNIK